MGNLINHSRGCGVIKVKKVKSRCLSQKIHQILPYQCWAGKTCLIIGGGPSLEGFDWNQLSGHLTIGINKAFQTYHATVNYSMDYNFFDWVHYNVKPEQPHYQLHQDWLKYQGIKVFLRHDKAHVFAEGTYYIDEMKQKAISFDLDQGMYGGNNSGMGALMLAVALGCKKIGLLGYDFKMVGGKTHFHEGYKNSPRVDTFVSNLESYRACIDELGPKILELGVDVVNLSPISALKSFPKSDIKTFMS